MEEIATGHCPAGRRRRRFFGASRSILLLLFLVTHCGAGESILVRENPREFTVDVVYTLTFQGGTPSELWASLPLPESNPYQDIARIGNAPGEIRGYPETGGKFYYVNVLAGPPHAARHSFHLTAYDISADFSRITEVYPPNKNSDLYRKYTGKSGEYVDPDNPDIARMAMDLGKSAADDLDYARRAYELVAKKYRFVEADGEGLLPLREVLKRGSGACGNLSSIYISLLRRRGIPARHLVGYQTNGKPHVLADFHLERYGWIPVDVTWHATNPKRDCFGKIKTKNPVVVLSCGADLTISGYRKPMKINAMQQGGYWWRTRSGTLRNFRVGYSFTAKEVKK